MSASARRQQNERARQRIAEYVGKGFVSLRDAAILLDVNHSTLWRAVRGLNARGPSVEVCTALADHSGKPTDYFFGRGD